MTWRPRVGDRHTHAQLYIKAFTLMPKNHPLDTHNPYVSRIFKPE